jgi:hypothetical protein
MNRSASIVAAVLLFAPGLLRGQDFDVFDLSDFVDPRLRHVVFDRSGGTIVYPGHDFKIIRVATGAVSMLSSRRVPGNGDAEFLEVAASSYFRQWQGSLKLSSLRPLDSVNKSPNYRMTAEFGFYGLDPQLNMETRETEYSPTRTLFGISIEQNPLDGSSGRVRRFNRDLFLQTDSDLFLISKVSKLTGTGLLLIRDEPGKHRLYRDAALFRFGEWDLKGRARIGASFEYGFEKDGPIHWSPFRAGVWLTVDAGQLGNVNITVTPSYQPALPGRRVFNEVAVFLDRTLYASRHKPSAASTGKE